MLRIIISIIITVLFISCKKEEEILLEAEFSSDSFGDYRKHLLIKKDSTFELKVYDRVFDDPIKKDSLLGKVKIQQDTIYFYDSNKFFWAKKAILKNHFIEFFQDNITYKLEIIQTKLNQSQTIDYSQFPNYAVFLYFDLNDEKRFYEISTNDLVKIDQLIKNEFKVNSRLSAYTDYIIQVSAFLNSDDDVIVDVNLFCNDIFNENSFKFSQIWMTDGGNCNIWIELNLSKNEILNTHIAGSL